MLYDQNKPINPQTAAQVEEALRLYQGDFLNGFFIREASRFDDWLREQQAYWRRLVLTGMNLLGDFYQKSGDYLNGINLVKRVLQIDPLDERAYQRLMILLADSDQRSEALQVYEQCTQILLNELGIEPSQETMTLYRDIRDDQLSAWNRHPKGKTRPAHNLPRQLTELIGRENDIEYVKALLEQVPLVTICGPGGVGKTRLALQIADGFIEHYEDGVWLVDLASLDNPDQVLPTAARAIGLYLDSSPQAEQALIEYCRQRQLLLVLDNCEHLIEACVNLIRAVLKDCPYMKVLATSRELLGITGESIYSLQPLAVPDLNTPTEFQILAKNESVRLFTVRATAVRPNFSIRADNAAAVAQVCIQLEGIPLALELAAAWVRVLPVEQISQNLVRGLDFLRGANRGALPRLQTMRACLDWSFDLLTQNEQAVLTRLSVFAGSWTLEAAEAVCIDCCSSTTEMLVLLNQLVSKSLVMVYHAPEIETRYRLLEPIRQYALEKLHSFAKTESVRDHHLAYYQSLVEEAKPYLYTHEQIGWLQRLERELPNLRHALDWAFNEEGLMSRLMRGLRMGADLRFFWQCRNRHLEGVGWLQRLLDLEKAIRGDLPVHPSMVFTRAYALTEMAHLCVWFESGSDVNSCL